MQCNIYAPLILLNFLFQENLCIFFKHNLMAENTKSLYYWYLTLKSKHSQPPPRSETTLLILKRATTSKMHKIV